MRVEEPGGPDAVTINPDRPVYQVNIFTRLSEPAEVPEASRGFVVSEWKLHETDVREVLEWARENAGSDPYTVAVAAVADDDGADLIHLLGEDPTRSSTSRRPYLLAPNVLVDLTVHVAPRLAVSPRNAVAWIVGGASLEGEEWHDTSLRAVRGIRRPCSA